MLLIGCLIVSVVAVDTANWLAGHQETAIPNLWVIPGTHHSAFRGAYNLIDSITAPWAICQTFSVKEQLEMGIRFTDIRLIKIDSKYTRATPDNLYISHTLMGSTVLSEFIEIVHEFLMNHPTEFVMVHVRPDERVETLNPWDMPDAWNVVRARYPGFIFEPKALDLSKVKVKDAAGKIVLLTDTRMPICDQDCSRDESLVFPGQGAGSKSLSYFEPYVRGSLVQLCKLQFKDQLKALRQFVKSPHPGNTFFDYFVSGLAGPSSEGYVQSAYIGKNMDNAVNSVAILNKLKTTSAVTGGMTIDPSSGFPLFLVNPLYNEEFISGIRDGSRNGKIGIILLDFAYPKLIKDLLESIP